MPQPLKMSEESPKELPGSEGQRKMRRGTADGEEEKQDEVLGSQHQLQLQTLIIASVRQRR